MGAALAFRKPYIVLFMSALLGGWHPAGGETVNEPLNLVRFGAENPSQWRVINDGVMGGLSRGSIILTNDGTGLFTGELSLENNGGFASVRTMVDSPDLSEYAGLEVRVKGDGRTYQLRLRDNQRTDGLAYRAVFQTKIDTWLTVRIPFKEFVPTFRGRIIDGAPVLDTAHIHQVGFMIADKVSGPFSLEIEFVQVWNPESEK